MQRSAAMTSFVILSSMLAFCQASPFFTSQPQQLSVVRGDDVTFSCAVQDNELGLPVFWSHGDVILSSNTDVFTPPSSTSKYNISVERVDHGIFTVFKLIIHSANDDHEGDYKCQVPGQQTMIQNNALIVLVAPSIVHFAPNTTYHDVTEYADVELECRASGRPDALIVWTRRRRHAGRLGGNIEHNDDVLEQVLANDSVLSMTSLSRHDSGVYTCKAYNDAGSDTRHVVIDVIYPPKVHGTESLVRVGVGLKAEIVCSFEASSPYEVDWMHDNSEIDMEASADHKFSQSSSSESGLHRHVLTIGHIEVPDTGVYTCIVSNKLDEVTQDFLVSGKPFDFSITSDPSGQYSDQYTLRWSVQSLSPITGYQLQVIDATTADDVITLNETAWMTINNSDLMTSNSYVITALKPNTLYTCYLMAGNMFGFNDPPANFVFTTAQEGRPAPIESTITPTTAVVTTSTATSRTTAATAVTMVTKTTSTSSTRKSSVKNPITTTTAQPSYRYQQVRLDRNIHNAGSGRISSLFDLKTVLIATLSTYLATNLRLL